jgi:hypothetical protein
MVIVWREREHEEIDNQVIYDPEVINALRRCGLLKFFQAPNMREQKKLFRRW